MTEKEYINVRDLSNVLAADRLLRDVNFEHQPAIPREEYHDVIRKLLRWREALLNSIKTRNKTALYKTSPKEIRGSMPETQRAFLAKAKK